jgi:hypothetical protein
MKTNKTTKSSQTAAAHMKGKKLKLGIANFSSANFYIG